MRSALLGRALELKLRLNHTAHSGVAYASVTVSKRLWHSVSTLRGVIRYVDHAPWVLMDGVGAAWRAYDAAAADTTLHHELLDLVVASAKAKSILHPHGFWESGWGDTSLLPRYATELCSLSSVNAVPPINVVARRSEHGRAYASVLDCSFVTPSEQRALPPQSSTASFQLVLPTAWEREASALSSTQEELARHRPIVIILPGTGEQGFRRRRHYLSYPLAQLGVGTLIVEGAYYGSRRPPRQRGTKLACVTDLMVQGRTAIEESRAIIGWLRGMTDCNNIVAPAFPPAAGPEQAKPMLPLSHRAAARAQVPVDDGQSKLRGGHHPISAASIDVAAMSGWESAAQHCVSDAESALMAAAAMASANNRSNAVSHERRHDRADHSVRLQRLLHHVRSTSTVSGVPLVGTDLAIGPIVLAGTSMGGLHAAMTASMLPQRLGGVGVASWLGPPSAASVFTTGALARGCQWGILARQALRDSNVGMQLEADLVSMEAALPLSAANHAQDVWDYDQTMRGAAELRTLTAVAVADDKAAQMNALTAGQAPAHRGASTTLAASQLKVDDITHARAQVARACRLTDLTNFTPPATRTDAAIFVIAEQDRYVPLTPSVRSLWAGVRERWVGADIRSIRGGHVSAALFSIDTYAGTIVEVIRRLLRPSSTSGRAIPVIPPSAVLTSEPCDSVPR